MKILLITGLLCFPFLLFAQAERKDIRKGNNYYDKNKYEDAEVYYRKALERQFNSYEATFNLGDALYKQKKFQEAQNQFQALQGKKLSKEELAKIYHNLGNTFLQSGKLQESIDAYKNALRNNPKDIETKYNLSYAMNLLKKSQNQKQQQGNQNKQDQKQQNQQQQQQQQQQQSAQEQKAKQDDKKEGEKKDAVKISKKDAERILQAIENEEKQTIEKVEKQKAVEERVRTGKNW